MQKSTKITFKSAQEFSATILTHLPSTLDKDYSILCRAWRRATGADWIWLWLIHTPSEGMSAMQLVARSQSKANIPKDTHHFNSKSVAAYCARTGSIEKVEENFSNWSKTIGNDTYKVHLASELRALKCKKFVCVPILLPRLSPTGKQIAPQNMPVITGVICLHYKQICNFNKDTFELLEHMSQVSAQALLNSYQALQRTVHLKLDELAHRYLTTPTRNMQTTCREYASKVVNVITNQLQVEGVSLFYRDSLRGGVQCLASTGLMWANGNLVEDLAEVHYRPNQGRTGKCFMNRVPLVLTNGMDQKKPPHTVETINGRPRIELPATIYPIPLPDNTHITHGDPKALGVIRCKFHKSYQIGEKELCFDAIEMQTLDFIAQQIAPVLDTMEFNISRERVVSVTKHDLYAPVAMMRHKLFNLRIKKDAFVDEEYIAVAKYDIWDLGICTMMCLNLITQLDADPRHFIPDPVFEQLSVEARVVAPLKNMLIHYANESKEMSIRFDGFGTFPELWLDAILIQRALFNLIINAIKYGKRKAQIGIVGRTEYDSYCIDVYNEGGGINIADVDRIFVPGYRSPDSQHLAIGLGLGLPIARACVEKCGGKLTLRNRKDPTIFSIVLPKELADIGWNKP